MQTQLNEAMKPGKLDSRSSIGDSALSVGEPSLTSSSILAKDKSFPSAPSTINSLLAGDKIQFGAVTSPTILPPSSRAIRHGIGYLGVCHPDIQMANNLSAADNQRSTFFGKDKHSNESSIQLEDCEAEAEARKTDGTQDCTSNSFSQNTSSSFKTQLPIRKLHLGGMVLSQNGISWEESIFGEKNFPSSKMKQIYVAKQTTGATSTVL